MSDKFLTCVFIAGLLLLEAIRYPHRIRNKSDRLGSRIVDSRIDAAETLTMTLSIVGLWLAPHFHGFTDWLDFADYGRPFWLGALGAAPVAASVWIHFRAHGDLGKSWSPTLEVSQGQRLVTDGVYGAIRHPIYLGVWLSAMAQALMIGNWIAGPIGLLAFLPMYAIRLPREEQLMIDHFGDDYRACTTRVGGLLPRR